MPASGAELPFDSSLWNDGGKIQNSNNCYSYAANDPLGHNLKCKPQPGLAAGMGMPQPPATCSDIAARAVADGFIVSDCDLPCNSGFYKVALFVDETVTGKWDTDYHWYRQDQGGCWSHKAGWRPASQVDASGHLITDPRTANRNYGPTEYGGQLDYHKFCDCFCVPQVGIRTACP